MLVPFFTLGIDFFSFIAIHLLLYLWSRYNTIEYERNKINRRRSKTKNKRQMS